MVIKLDTSKSINGISFEFVSESIFEIVVKINGVDESFNNNNGITNIYSKNGVDYVFLYRDNNLYVIYNFSLFDVKITNDEFSFYHDNSYLYFEFNGTLNRKKLNDFYFTAYSLNDTIFNFLVINGVAYYFLNNNDYFIYEMSGFNYVDNIDTPTLKPEIEFLDLIGNTLDLSNAPIGKIFSFEVYKDDIYPNRKLEDLHHLNINSDITISNLTLTLSKSYNKKVKALVKYFYI